MPWSMYLDANVSWEGHLAGGISGLIVALIFSKHSPQKPHKDWMDEFEDETNEVYAVYGSYCRIIDKVVIKIDQDDVENDDRS